MAALRLGVLLWFGSLPVFGQELFSDLAKKLETERALPPITLVLTHNEEPVAARIRLYQKAGAPLKALPTQDHFYAEGRCSFQLPVGQYNLWIKRGPRVWPWQGVVAVTDKGAEPIECELQPYLSLERKGWWLCDPFVDAGSAPELYSTIGDVSLAGRGEGVEVLGIGAAGQLKDAAGRRFGSLPQGDAQLELALLNHHKSRFVPLLAETGTLASGARMYWIHNQPAQAVKVLSRQKGQPYFSFCSALHDQQAVVVLNAPLARPCAGELLFDLAAGTSFDAIDIGNDPDQHRLWHILLSQGHQIPALAGGPVPAVADKPLPADSPASRLYLYHSERKFSPQEALVAIRRGKSIVSNGPFVTLQILTAGPGDTLHPQKEPQPVTMEAYGSADPADSIDRIEIVYNGVVIYTWKGSQLQRQVKKTIPLLLPNVGWVLARYHSKKKGLYAFTNPIYLSAAGYRLAAPVLAKAEMNVVDAKTGAPLRATVTVAHLGRVISSHQVGEEALTFTAPATAVLAIAAVGYQTCQKSLYELGPAKTLAAWQAKSSAKKLLLNPNAYRAMRTHLQSLRLTIALQPMKSD